MTILYQYNITMTKNTGKSSEQIFENTLRKLYGSKVFIQEFYDAAYLHGLNKKPVKAPEQPADRLVTLNGQMFYAEIKSVSKGTSFPFGMIKPNQLRASKLALLAGGNYLFMVHDLQSDIFYRVPASLVLSTQEAGKQSLKWSEMEVWEDYETYKGLK